MSIQLSRTASKTTTPYLNYFIAILFKYYLVVATHRNHLSIDGV